MKIDALTFDVFGTLADWRRGIIEEGARLRGDTLPPVPLETWMKVADQWMRLYGKWVSSYIRDGQPEGRWINLDEVLRQAYWDVWYDHLFLDEMPHDANEKLSTVWSRLPAHADAIAGFNRLDDHFTLAALSNANRVMQVSLKESTGLPFGCLLSAEAVKQYKPSPLIYRMALKSLGRPADRVLMVAAHTFDLNAARKEGFRTALITREGEPGSDPSGLDHEADFVVSDIDELSRRLV